MKLGTSFYWEEKEKTTDMSSSSDPAPKSSKEEKNQSKSCKTLRTQPELTLASIIQIGKKLQELALS
jgi:hypothetical protein